MPNRCFRIALSCVVGLQLTGCTASRVPFTEFLGDYAQLEPHAEITGAYVYWTPGVDLAKYNAVLVDPIAVHFAPDKKAKQPTPERLQQFKRFVDKELADAISEYWAISDDPGEDVVRLRLQVSNVHLMKHLPRTSGYSHLPHYQLGSANIEAELTDSVSGDRMAAYVSPHRAARQVEQMMTPKTWEDVKDRTREGIRNWVRRLALRREITND